VAVLLCALVTAMGATARLIYPVSVQGEPAAAFLQPLSAYGRPSDLWLAMLKPVAFANASALTPPSNGLHASGVSSRFAAAVNASVVLAFVTVFVVNTVASAVYGLAVPTVGNY